MASPEFLRAKAAELRALAAQARVPEAIVQLELWAREFEEQASRAKVSRSGITLPIRSLQIWRRRAIYQPPNHELSASAAREVATMRDQTEDNEILALLAQKLKADRSAGVIAGTIRADQDGLDTAIDVSVKHCGARHLLVAASSLIERAVELLAAMPTPPMEIIDRAELAIDLVATALAGEDH
jgi:hypothetical protein